MMVLIQSIYIHRVLFSISWWRSAGVWWCGKSEPTENARFRQRRNRQWSRQRRQPPGTLEGTPGPGRPLHQAHGVLLPL